MHRPGVVVIGGGFAGLSAAVLLARSGVQVTVLEARGQLGGRASSFRDRETGEWVDNGQHVLLGCYHETFAFLRAIGAARDISLQEALEVAFVDQRQRVSLLTCPRWRPPLNLVGGLLGWRGVGLGARLSALRLGGALGLARRDLPASLDGMVRPGETVTDWLARHGQHEALCAMLWEPLALAALNQDPAEASASPFVRVLRQMLGASSTGAASTGAASTGSSSTDSALAVVTSPRRRNAHARARDAALGIPAKPLTALYGEPARALIEASGGQVRLHSLARVRLAGARLVGVEVRGAPDQPPERLEAAAVIVAVPWFDLPRMFVDETEGGPPDVVAPLCRAAEETAPSPIVSVNLWFDRQVLPRPFLGLPGRALQWAFDKRAVFGDDASHVTLVGSGASRTLRLSNDDLTRLALGELREALPAAGRAAVRRTLVVREPRATFSVAPGQPPRPTTTTLVPNLMVAGDWVDTGLPGTIEGACLSGRRAADEIKSRFARVGTTL